MDNWFTIDRIDSETIIISEYRHWEETHCYLLNGKEKSLLIDTGLDSLGALFSCMKAGDTLCVPTVASFASGAWSSYQRKRGLRLRGRRVSIKGAGRLP